MVLKRCSLMVVGLCCALVCGRVFAETRMPPASAAVQPMTPLQARCWAAANPADDPRPLLLAVLSSRMVYSVTEWSRLQAVAQAAGFRVQVWWDPLDTPADTLHTPSVLAVPPGCEAAWGTLNHFPYVRVALRHRVHAWPVWGVMPDAAWRETLLARAHDLAPAVSKRPEHGHEQ